MIVAVSTIKDTAANVDRYVSRNLANGVDHLVVFTEDTGAEAEALLDAHPSVTHVPTGGDWWPRRPDDLNVRQRANANLARVLLAPFAWAEWLVHIDGDEVVLLDRERVEGLPDDQRTFRMVPLEAVSRDAWPGGEVTHFKRLLDRDELGLLKALKLVRQPDNNRYFHGHTRGKVGVRLRTDCRLGLHVVKGGRGRYVSTTPEPGFSVLHYDSATADEFVRKFMTLAASGSSAVYRNSRTGPVNAMRTLAAMDLPDEVRARYLRRLYELTTMEDFETLHDLGLLEEVRADAGTHVPAAFPPDDLARFEALLAAARAEPRDDLTLDSDDGGYAVLRAALAATGQDAGPAQAVLDKVEAKIATAAAAAESAAEAARVERETAGQTGRRPRPRLPRWRA